MANLKVGDLRPFVPAKDFALSKQFYAALGWTVKELDHGLALVAAHDQRFYLQDFDLKIFAKNYMLHLTVDDAQAWYEHASSVLRNQAFAGARVQPPQRQAYGALVTFVHDPAGVLLHLCQWDR